MIVTNFLCNAQPITAITHAAHSLLLCPLHIHYKIIYLYYSVWLIKNYDLVPTDEHLMEPAPRSVSPGASTTALVYCDTHEVPLRWTAGT
jgi:hypothetical protein